MSKPEFRIERDSMGELEVPAAALWGAQTQRAVQNFPISGRPMPREFIRAVALIKAAAARANARWACWMRMWPARSCTAADEVAAGEHDAQFPDRRVPDRLGHQHQHECQRGDRAPRGAARSGSAVHANDHVNMSQSSNDVIPDRDSRQRRAGRGANSCCPALEHLAEVLQDEGGARSAPSSRPAARI